jgi:hypothetical protein
MAAANLAYWASVLVLDSDSGEDMTKVQTVIDRANSDPTFCSRLRTDPASVFREAGLELPKGAAVEVIDANRGDIHLLLGPPCGIG